MGSDVALPAPQAGERVDEVLRVDRPEVVARLIEATGDPGDVDCTQFVLRVHEYIDEEMTETERERLRRHLAACAPCLDEYRRDVLLKALVRRSCACEQAPPTLRVNILTHISMTYVQRRDRPAG